MGIIHFVSLSLFSFYFIDLRRELHMLLLLNMAVSFLFKSTVLPGLFVAL